MNLLKWKDELEPRLDTRTLAIQNQFSSLEKEIARAHQGVRKLTHMEDDTRAGIYQHYLGTLRQAQDIVDKLRNDWMGRLKELDERVDALRLAQTQFLPHTDLDRTVERVVRQMVEEVTYHFP